MDGDHLSHNADITTPTGGIAGVRRRLDAPHNALCAPFYADISAGAAAFTWRAYLGVAYITSMAEFSPGYGYLSFLTRYNSAPPQKLKMGGPMLATTFRL